LIDLNAPSVLKIKSKIFKPYLFCFSFPFKLNRDLKKAAKINSWIEHFFLRFAKPWVFKSFCFLRARGCDLFPGHLKLRGTSRRGAKERLK